MRDVTLADLKPGVTVRIEAVTTADASVQRLMVLGLVEGAELTFLRASLGGDPLEFRVFGASISLRREQARHFEVTHLGDSAAAPSTRNASVGAASSRDSSVGAASSRDSSVGAASSRDSSPAPRRDLR